MSNVTIGGLSRDETLLAYTVDSTGQEQHKLNVLNLKTGLTHQITPEGVLDLPCGFSQDGKTIFTARGEHIWGEKAIMAISVETGEAKTLFAESGAWLQCEDVSANGQWIAIKRFVSNNQQHIGLLNRVSGDVDWLSQKDGVGFHNAFFHVNTLHVLSNIGGDRFRAYRWAQDKFSPMELPVQGLIVGYSISENGQLAVSYRDGLAPRTSLFEPTSKGEWEQIQIGDGNALITSLILTQGNPDRIFFKSEDGSPPRLNMQENSRSHVLIDTNATGLPPSDFARYRSMLIPSFDGTEIPTHIMIPEHASAENPVPLVMYIHGGPEDHEDPFYSAGNQILANAGFAIGLPNVRGSSGFGAEYMNMDNGDWGGAHIKDILAVADYLAELPEIKDHPRFIIGGSFGGFSVLSAVSQYPNAFDAGVDIFGVVDLATFVDSLPPQVQRYFIREIGFDPHKNVAKSQAISPLYNAQHIKVPLQIHQGTNDVRVLHKQSRLMVDALQTNGIKVEYYEYEGEGHGFSPKNDALMKQRVVDFLVQHRDAYE